MVPRKQCYESFAVKNRQFCQRIAKENPANFVNNPPKKRKFHKKKMQILLKDGGKKSPKEKFVENFIKGPQGKCRISGRKRFPLSAVIF